MLFGSTSSPFFFLVILNSHACTSADYYFVFWMNFFACFLRFGFTRKVVRSVLMIVMISCRFSRRSHRELVNPRWHPQLTAAVDEFIVTVLMVRRLCFYCQSSGMLCFSTSSPHRTEIGSLLCVECFLALLFRIVKNFVQVGLISFCYSDVLLSVAPIMNSYTNLMLFLSSVADRTSSRPRVGCAA